MPTVFPTTKGKRKANSFQREIQNNQCLYKKARQTVHAYLTSVGKLPDHVSNGIIASMGSNLTKVHKHGLQAFADPSHPKYSLGHLITWQRRLNQQPLSEQCKNSIDRIYRTPAGSLKTKTARRVAIFNILRNHCIGITEKVRGTTGTYQQVPPKWSWDAANNTISSHDWYGYRSMHEMLTDEHKLRAFFVQFRIPVNRVKMFFDDMLAIGELARLMSVNQGIDKRIKISEILSKNNYELAYGLGKPTLPRPATSG